MDLKDVKNKLEQLKSIWEETLATHKESNLTIVAALFTQTWNAIMHATHKTIQLYKIFRPDIIPAKSEEVFNSIIYGLKILFGQ